MADITYHMRTLGIRVIYEPPNHGWWGAWLPDSRTVLVHPELSPIQRAYVLAHEIGHAHCGHRGRRLCWEVQADLFAARLLIDESAWTFASAAHKSISDVARELGVHPRVVRIYHYMMRRQV